MPLPKKPERATRIDGELTIVANLPQGCWQDECPDEATLFVTLYDQGDFTSGHAFICEAHLDLLEGGAHPEDASEKFMNSLAPLMAPEPRPPGLRTSAAPRPGPADLDKRRQAELNGVGRDDRNACVVTDNDAEDPQNDPLRDVPDLERVTGNHGIIPESLSFWRRNSS